MMKRFFYTLTVILLAANLDAGVFGRKNVTPHCGNKIVSYKFVGAAGTRLVYGSKTFTIPGSGVIELVADRNQTSFQVAGKSVQIQTTTTDEFGTATVELASL